MSTGYLWLEITIAGAPYVLAMCFLVLWVLGITDLKELEPAKDYLAYLTPVGVVASYIMGLAAHRLFQIIGTPVIRRITLRGACRVLVQGCDQATLDRGCVALWQCGSDRLIRAVDSLSAHDALFRLLAVSAPALGVSAAIWCSSAGIVPCWLPLFLGVVVGGLAAVVWYPTRAELVRVRQAAFEEILSDELHRKAGGS